MQFELHRCLWSWQRIVLTCISHGIYIVLELWLRKNSKNDRFLPPSHFLLTLVPKVNTFFCLYYRISILARISLKSIGFEYSAMSWKNNYKIRIQTFRMPLFPRPAQWNIYISLSRFFDTITPSMPILIKSHVFEVFGITCPSYTVINWDSLCCNRYISLFAMKVSLSFHSFTQFSHSRYKS